MGDRLLYIPVALLVRLIGALPRPMARGAGILMGGAVYHLHLRLRRVGMRNLQLAFPEKTKKERRKILARRLRFAGPFAGRSLPLSHLHDGERLAGCGVSGLREF